MLRTAKVTASATTRHESHEELRRPRVAQFSAYSRPSLVSGGSGTGTQLDVSELNRYDISVLLADEALEHGQEGMHSFSVGGRDWVSVFSPQLAKDVLTSNVFDKVTVLDELKSAYKNGVLVRSFRESIERRKALQPIFSSMDPDVLVNTFSSTALDVCDHLAHQQRDAGYVSVEPVMQGLALDSLCKSLLKYDIRARFGEMEGGIEAIDYVVKEASRRAIVSGAYEKNTEQDKKLHDCKAMVESLLHTVVGATEPGDGTVVDMLTQKNDDPQAMADDALNLVYNATHTSGAAISWCLFCLAQQPEQWTRLRDEVFSYVQDATDIDYNTILELKQCRSAIVEALRLFPGPPRIYRESVTEATLSNKCVIPQGTGVWVDLLALQRNPNVFQDAYKFDFTRWLDERTEWSPSASLHPTSQDTSYAYLPFGAGARGCLGNTFAMLEATTALATIVTRFQAVSPVSAPEDMGIEASFAAITTRTGMHLRFE